jgi:antitoxin component YwqK of YwqJK toxin-antitoxin module
MKKIQVISLVITILFFSCSPGKSNRTNYYTKGNLVYRSGSNQPYTGDIFAKTEGKLFEYKVKDGLKNGEFKISYDKGNLIMKGNIVNDKNEGKWVYFYPSGELESEGYYKDNRPDSIWTWYFPDGKVKERGMFVEGTRRGDWKMFDETGTVTMENIYVLSSDSANRKK